MIKAEVVEVNDPRVEYIDQRVNDLIGEASDTQGIDPTSVAFIVITQIVRQFAYGGVQETAAWLAALHREVASNYADEKAQRDRFAAGDDLRERMNTVALQVMNELEEARANGRVS